MGATTSFTCDSLYDCLGTSHPQPWQAPTYCMLPVWGHLGHPTSCSILGPQSYGQADCCFHFIGRDQKVRSTRSQLVRVILDRVENTSPGPPVFHSIDVLG